ncbi:MAG: hypothetical protein NTW78_02095 [Campylobacterales bacterium]|nr:hypothetical protein [Campylobacterales bacterium]
MLPLLGLFGPVGWGIAGVLTVGTAAYKYLDDDDDEQPSRDYGAEARREEKRESDNQVREEIRKYKVKETERLKSKYGVIAEFIQENSLVIQDNQNEFAMSAQIDLLEIETDELIKLIGELEVMKHESIN